MIWVSTYPYLLGPVWRFFTPSDVRSASDQMLETDPPEMEWKGLVRSALDALSKRPTVCLPETKRVRRSTRQPIKWSSREYLATLTRLQSHTRIIGKRNLFDFATIFTRLTAQSCTGKRGSLQWNNWIANDFLLKLWANNGCRFWKHRFGPIDWPTESNPGSRIQRICLEWKGAADPRSDAKSDANCARSEANRTPDGVKKRLYDQTITNNQSSWVGFYRVDCEVLDDTMFDTIGPVFLLKKAWLKTGYFVWHNVSLDFVSPASLMKIISQFAWMWYLRTLCLWLGSSDCQYIPL